MFCALGYFKVILIIKCEAFVTTVHENNSDIEKLVG